MKKTFQVIALVLGVTLLSVGGGYSFLKAYRYFNPYLDTEISGPITLTSDWLEIKPQRPLQVKRQVQEFIINVPASFKADWKAQGFRMPDGSLVTFEAELIDEQGTTYKLRFAGLSDESIGLRADDLPSDKVYPMVRIKAAKQVRVSRVYWRCHNEWDVS